MPRKGHSEEQIVYALRQVEAGKKVGDVCREMGVSQQAFYSWKKRYAGVGVSECSGRNNGFMYLTRDQAKSQVCRKVPTFKLLRAIKTAPVFRLPSA